MGKRIDQMLVLDMLFACEKLTTHVGQVTLQEFIEDEYKSAVAFKYVTILGEAASNLSEEFLEKYPELPFHKMRGIRNRIVHGYYDINPEILWNAVRVEVPILEVELLEIKLEMRL